MLRSVGKQSGANVGKQQLQRQQRQFQVAAILTAKGRIAAAT